MKFSERRQEESGIDLTPFIDVVFMLLLFFVVSTTLFKEVTQLKVELPEAHAKAVDKNSHCLEVGIDENGQYFLDGKPVGPQYKRLKKILAEKLREDKLLPLVIVGDKAAPHQAVVSALEVAAELGVTQVQIVAKQEARQQDNGL
ncbi:biopolymer transporter ExbD [Candidatus Berkiella aquae]|uniref:Biopolymer transport protein ExbD n=1 Tax=Candidatus Berkiella aquae TaxID=295108 RepID=A0A0Q9YYL4_9GAMM|nr:biopolymer transporter ExbD [Candidatus Berkiella aquae]MCS5711790.1 biopolymer transporter ExbD [Candidatus Berkiella aquae]